VRGSCYKQPCPPRSLSRIPSSLGAEARYRWLFDHIDAGFCIIEVKFDAYGVPQDYRFLETNPAFQRHSGLLDADGRWMRDLVPGRAQNALDCRRASQHSALKTGSAPKAVSTGC